jgi:hypothetical protein
MNVASAARNISAIGGILDICVAALHSSQVPGSVIPPKPSGTLENDDIVLAGGCLVLLCFAFLSIHAAVNNAFSIQRHLISRKTLRQFRAEAMSA